VSMLVKPGVFTQGWATASSRQAVMPVRVLQLEGASWMLHPA
jgi:hypothetical protein